MMFRASAFIFDMDGTMVDNMGFHTQSWLELFTALGVQLDAEEFQRRTSGKTTGETLRQIIGPHLSDDEIVALSERKESLYRNLYSPHLRPVAGLIRFLDAARWLDIPMAVATSAGRGNIQFVLDGLGVTSYFKVIVGGEDVQHSKPHPEMFLIAAQRLGIRPEHCLVFEDSLAGIEAARRAGMEAIVVMTSLGTQDIKDRDTVKRVIRDFASLNPASLLIDTQD